MVYATVEQMIARFGEEELIQLTDRDGQAGAVVTQVAQVAIDDATALINGYLSGRYQLPLTSPPDALARLCCDMARYGLHDDGASEPVERRNDAAIRFLEKVASGAISLGISTGGTTATSTDLPVIEHQGAVFSRNNSKGFI